MSFGALVLIAIGTSYATVWLVNYAPLYSTIFGKPYSPRLMVCKLLIPFDIIISLIVVIGGSIGAGAMSTGIGMVTYGVLTNIGISLGILVIHKFFIPRWRKQFNQIRMDAQRAII